LTDKHVNSAISIVKKPKFHHQRF